MKCYFLRHGIALDRADWNGDDDDRPLTSDGIERMECEATTLAAMHLKIDAIVTSPLVRAKETAKIVGHALKMNHRLVEDVRLGAADFGPAEFAAIASDYKTCNAIMLVGHEPTMSQTIGHLIGGARIELKKGGLACVEFPDDSTLAGTLRWLLPPKALAS